MTKPELFARYSLNETHKNWDDKIDSWNSVEIYRLMHDGKLPPMNDKSIWWLIQFLDNSQNDIKWWRNYVMILENRKSLILTAKRMIFKHADQIINPLIK